MSRAPRVLGLMSGTSADGVDAALLAAASLSTRPMRDIADAVPDLHAAMGGWAN